MRALLTDLDRTLTGPDLVPDPAALARIEALRAAGLAVVLVTGRDLAHLTALAPRMDAVVAENGGVLLAPPAGPEVADPAFVLRAQAALGKEAELFRWSTAMASGPRRLASDAGRALAAAGVAHSLEWNAEEVMVLPGGIDKGVGARRALARLGIDPREAAAIGDGENDVALFRAVGRSAAVANASPEARRAASVVTSGAYSRGFVEFVDALLREVRR